MAVVSAARLHGSALESDTALEFQRLRIDALLCERLLKETAHEIWHLLGLPHCKSRRCVMSISRDVQAIDAKCNELCWSCWLEVAAMRFSSMIAAPM